jgi:hypothetical protein
MPPLCVHIGEESSPESISKMVDDKRAYPVLLHALHTNCNNIEAAVTLPFMGEGKVSPCGFNDLMLFLECYRLSRVPLGRRKAGFYLNEAECPAMPGNNIDLVAVVAVIALNDTVSIFDKKVCSESLTLLTEEMRVVRFRHGFSPS